MGTLAPGGGCGSPESGGDSGFAGDKVACVRNLMLYTALFSSSPFAWFSGLCLINEVSTRYDWFIFFLKVNVSGENTSVMSFQNGKIFIYYDLV